MAKRWRRRMGVMILCSMAGTTLMLALQGRIREAVPLHLCSVSALAAAEEEYEIEIPFEINGFEYQIREASNCIREGRTHSGIYTPQMSLQTLSLIDDIRASWSMKFPFEK